MNTFSHKNALFTTSGCLSPEAMDKYTSKQLSSEELALVNKHIAGCPFCKDALEGAQHVPDFAAHSQQINERLRRRFRYIPGRGKTRSTVLSGFLIPVAASVIVLVGIFAWFQYYYPEKQELAVVLDTIPVQAEEIEIREESETITESEQPVESTTVGGVFAEKEDIPEASPPPEEETPVTIAVVDNDVVAEDDIMDEAYTIETEMLDEQAEIVEMEEKAGATHTGMEAESAKKSPVVSRQKESQDMTFTIVEQMPEFPGGMDSLHVFIQRNIKVPDERKNKLVGVVYASFTVSKKGKVKNVSILRGLGKEIDAEVVRVLKMLPDWKPGMQRGKPVAVDMSIPIKF